MMDVFLSLYVLEGTNGGGSILPFLVAALSQEEADDISDTFVDGIECLANPKASVAEHVEAQAAVRELRSNLCMIEDPAEIRMISACLTASNPNIEAELGQFKGGVFTVSVEQSSGFPEDTAKTLRSRMAKHHVLNSLSVEFE